MTVSFICPRKGAAAMSRRKIDREVPSKGNYIDLKTGELTERAALPLICERIRHYRLHQGMEQKVFAEKIGAQANTVSNWEKGRSRPDVSLLPLICEALGITLPQLFGLEAPEDMLTERESRLISHYRELNAGDQYTVDTLVKTMLTVEQARVHQRSRRKVYELPLVGRTLAAGIGDPTEYEGLSEPFYLYDVPCLDRADCVFKVNGDSMEPEYHHGDYVLIQRIPDAPALAPGEIGAFAVGNELYIKEYRKDGLHSLNTSYPVMTFDEDTRVYLIGRVLSVVDKKDIASGDDIRLYQIVRGNQA